MTTDKELWAWIISAAGPDCTRRFEAPIRLPGWDRPPWIELRPLSEREQLERESLGVYDEYHLDPNGDIERVVRRYDQVAMARYDYEHCLVDFCLPQEETPGEIALWRKPETLSGDELLAMLPPALAEWLTEVIEQINLRRPADQKLLSEVKKTNQRRPPTGAGAYGAPIRPARSGYPTSPHPAPARGSRLLQPGTTAPTATCRR